MLIRSAERLDQGDHIACSFFLPDGTRISATGEIVRVAGESGGGQGARSYGIRFLSITSEAEEAIAVFVERDRRASISRTPGPEAVA